MFLVAILDKAEIFDVPNKLFTPDVEHCANVPKQFGIFPWNKTLFVHSSKFSPQESASLIHSVYASIHSAFASNAEDVVVVLVLLAVDVFTTIVGIREPTVAETILGRAVAANAAGIAHKTAIKPIVLLKKCICLTPLLLFYYIIFSDLDK